MSYTVYTAYTAENIGSGPRNHIFIFVETAVAGSGLKFHVIGNILQGMTYEKKAIERPEKSAEFIPGSRIRVGNIEASDMGRFELACESVAVPGAQLKLNGRPKDPSVPVRRCTEWVQEVKEKIVAEKIVQQ